MANQWNNPETLPPADPSGWDTYVTCVVCDKKVRYGKTHRKERAPYFVCSPCGRQYANAHGSKWPDVLEKRLTGGKAAKDETVRLLSGTPMPPDKSSERRDKWLSEVFKHWIC